MSQKIAACIAGILSLGGIYYSLIVPCGFFWNYLSELTNPSRHEYIQGIFLSECISAVFWLPVPILLLFAKNLVPRKILLAGVAPIFLLSIFFLAVNGYVIVQCLIGN